MSLDDQPATAAVRMLPKLLVIARLIRSNQHPVMLLLRGFVFPGDGNSRLVTAIVKLDLCAGTTPWTIDQLHTAS